jgi:hypothetical protein
MKYVLMFTSRPDLDAEIDPDVMKADYAKIYAWFEENAAAIADGGAELLGVETATSVKYGPDGPVVVDGPSARPRRSSAGSRSSTSPTWTPRSRSRSPGPA